MATVVKAPNPVPYTKRSAVSIFLAGSIDLGNGENWRQQLERELADYDIVICNPHRDDWDSSWVDDISNDQFFQQVKWEIDHLDGADLKVFYFDPNGQAPITLLELGLMASQRGASDRVIVCCPEGYWRRGNVQIVCAEYQIELTDTIDQLIDCVKDRIDTQLWLSSNQRR